MADRPYIPLVAGMELVRRSGALTQYPPDYLLGNLPQPRMRVNRYAAEAMAQIPCQLPPGTELFNTLWYSDFGDVAAGGLSRSNYLWLPSPGTVENDGKRLVSSPGVPSNNVHGSGATKGVFHDAALFSANPVYTGNCARLRQTGEFRFFKNQGQGEHYVLFWADRPVLAPNETAIFTAGRQLGVFVSHATDDVYFTGVQTFDQPVSPYGYIESPPELVAGTVLMKIIQESTPNVGTTTTILKDGVVVGSFTDPFSWASPRLYMWPSVTLSSYYAPSSTSIEPAALYAGWKLETF